MIYKNRTVDSALDLLLESFGAVLITGPKGCGKTTTGKHKAQSFIEFQDEDVREQLLAVANTIPSKLLLGKYPRLIDEWQDAPKIWGAVRKSVDDADRNGLYILTGSSSRNIETPHTGTLRIATLPMRPMSLYESGESSGAVSLHELFDHPEAFTGCESVLSVDDLIFAICRGGWPRAINNKSPRSQLQIAKELFAQTYRVDASHIDGKKRNPEWVAALFRSYARNICTLSSKKTIFKDVATTTGLSESTFHDYIAALEALYIIEDVPAWCPAIRSKTAIRASPKRCFVDPSIAVAALGLKPEYFNTDFKTLGFLFEALCIRDLRVYAQALDGTVAYYRDRSGLESDVVLHLADGRYALIEVKLGSNGIDDGAKHLLEIERLVRESNKSNEQTPIRLPDLKLVLTGTQYGYRRPDGVIVIPVGSLKP